MSQSGSEDRSAQQAGGSAPGSPAQGLEVQPLLAAIVASSDDAIVSKDLNGIVRSWNAAAERIFGYSAQEMIGQSILKIIPPERPEEEQQILQRLRRGERIEHFETVRVRKDGQRIDVSVTISPVRDEHGRIIGASKIARDITALKRMLAEREQLLASEQAARREAERVSRMKDEFLATLSHELRTPLNAIIGWTHLLRSGAAGPVELAEGLQIIDRNARVQAQLVEDLLDMNRIISGKMRLNVRPVIWRR
ncbi:PAS domain S-box protein [Fontivita pretiosa]|uniref:PAS domain S-box protein n=1 Tax=Fontivita pretiosa TaxID=2989684 RepID=UPI003D182651